MTLSYAFGGNSGQSYDELQRRRAFAEGLLQRGMSGQPKTAIEGINSAASSILGALLARKFGAQEDAGRQEATNVFRDIISGGGRGGGGTVVPIPPLDPNSPQAIGADAMKAIGKQPNYPSKEEITAYIAKAAEARGIDPNIAIRVASSEGLNANPAEAWQSNFVKNGKREESYGPFQLYMGGGLGNQFIDQTGLDPRNPQTWQQQVDFALNHAAKNGWDSWYGADRAGIGDMDGIGNGVDPRLLEAMSNPYLNEGQKSALGMLLEQRIAANQPHKLDTFNGPDGTVYSIDPYTGQTKPLTGAKKPDHGYRMLTADEIKRSGLPDGSYQVSADGKISEVGGGGVNIDLGGGSSKQIFDSMDDKYSIAQSSMNALKALNEAETALNGGIISGYGANQVLGLKKLAATMGADDSNIVNTETFRAAMQPVVAATLKATVGGANISDADRAFAEKAVGGDITLDAGSIKRLIGVLRKANEGVVNDYKGKVDRVYPDDATGSYKRERAIFGLGDIPPPPPPPPGAPAQVTNDADYDALPSGTVFIGPDGQTRRKP